MDFRNTSEIILPRDPLEMVIGQEKAVDIARIVAKQRRHMLLVGPPGVGKSMLAKALAYHIPKPTAEIVVAHNPNNAERPFVFTRGAEDLKRQKTLEKKSKGKVISPSEAPEEVAEKLGFRCMGCSHISSSDEEICPKCKEMKFSTSTESSPFSELLSQVFNVEMYEYPEEEVHITRVDKSGKEEIIVYQNVDGKKIRVLDSEAFKNLSKLEPHQKSRVLVPLKRNCFVQATGASETELLGDVKHDPWGGMPEAGGLLPYQRVIAGAIHEAHEGVLFVDELPQLKKLQHHLLTAMQEKHFPISGMNPTSAGAAVKVNKVPCDFIFIGACNISELEHILAPLRSRILGSGYELLLETTMEKTPKNEEKIAQFFAQEVILDAKIPHGTQEAVCDLISESERRAKEIDGISGALSLRLRDLGGIIRLAGDLAKMQGAELIDSEQMRLAMRNSRSVEQQLVDKYGSLWEGQSKDNASNHLIKNEKKATGYL